MGNLSRHKGEQVKVPVGGWENPLDGIVQVRAERALRTLAEAGREALGFFEQGHFDAAQLEVDRARRAVRVLDEIRREQKREAS